MPQYVTVYNPKTGITMKARVKLNGQYEFIGKIGGKRKPRSSSRRKPKGRKPGSLSMKRKMAYVRSFRR